MACVETYRSIHGRLPPKLHRCPSDSSTPPSAYAPCRHGTDDIVDIMGLQPISPRWQGLPGYGNNALWRMRTLVWELRQIPECEEAMLRLGSRYFRADEAEQAMGSGLVFDAYNRAMDWDPEGGFNNGPVVISAGPDGKFGLVDRDDGSRTYRPSTEDSLKEQEDNIRTDGKTME